MYGGGGGPAEPVLQKESVLTYVVKSTCHPELDSGSVPCRELPVTLDRFRNGLARLAKNVPTCFQHSALRSLDSRSAFTMAEILLSLTIIGVVAAITLPSLTGNINERTWNTQRKALYARFSQAIALMPALNGYGTLRENTDSAGSTSIEDTAAETFITAGLSKVLKINNICDNEHLEDCGIASKFTDMKGNTVSIPLKMSELNSKMTSVSYWSSSLNTNIYYSTIDTKAAAFETQNGESILLFYQPGCVSNMGETGRYNVQPKVCANMIYDLNGTKGPNTFGKDIGILTVLYPSDSVVVAPVPFNTKFDSVPAEEASNVCTTRTGEDYRIPSKDEVISLFVNKDIIGFEEGDSHLFSSSKLVTSSGYITNWVLYLGSGEFRIPVAGDPWGVLCVKRN